MSTETDAFEIQVRRVTDEKILDYMQRLTSGITISRKSTLKVLEALTEERQEHARTKKQLEEVQYALADLSHKLHRVEIQNQELNRTISVQLLRGEITQGMPVDLEVTKTAHHGDVIPWSEAWGEAASFTCDWGSCNNTATVGRLDSFGHGWLPCCESCSKKEV